MEKNRLKRFISIINNFSYIIIFVMATTSLVSPGFFVCHKSDSLWEESREVLSETIPKSGMSYGPLSHTKPMGNGVVDIGSEAGILHAVKQRDWTLVSLKNSDEYAVKGGIEGNQKRFECITCHGDTREKWPEWSNFLSIF
ncbi:MAG: hypothetical protein EX341_13010 [Candidatus Scalindua sp. SCAELEC01]|nr:MAG: hypothetical protein EX341_13010 [Candidatus Scalindua sp. SCAELEC01]